MHRYASCLAWLAPALIAILALPGLAAPVSFRNDVMAVLSKAGCNSGLCHGNKNGKNGFKLSLRGQVPEFDLTSLTRDMLGRRIDRQRPANSLLLLKATGAVPHEGGKRFAVGSPEYDLLARWIRDGGHPDPEDTSLLKGLEVTPAEQVLVEPADRVQLHVRARFSDGSTRDVTRLAVYEPSNLTAAVSPDGEALRQQMGETAILVRYLDKQAVVRLAFVPARPGFSWRPVPEANYVDHHVFAKLRALRMRPSELCSDPVFLRRAYLDLLGLPPTAEETRAFLADRRPDKRGRLIDQLLGRPEFADFWALKWSDLLRNEEKVLDRKGVQALHGWVRRSLLDGKPLHQFARDLIAGRGSTYAHPAANYYRALRDPYIRAEATAQVFLGVRLQCAKCHNHPFDRWTQDDYHRLAAFFPRVQYRILENNRRDKLDKHEFDGEQIVWLDRESELPDPRTGEPLAPKFLGAPTLAFARGADRLQALADWVASRDNPFFARAQANRIWFHLMGRGLVDPNDDFRTSNPPVNPPLLDALAKDLVEHDFDLRHLIRTIMNSRTYQLSATPNDTNRDDEMNFSHALVRPVQAEALLDAIAQVTGVPARFHGFPEGTRAGQLPGVGGPRRRGDAGPTEGEQFLKVFGKPVRSLSCECERSDDATLNQAFQLITGELMSRGLSEPDNVLGRLLASRRTDREIIEQLYLKALSRYPSEKETTSALGFVQKSKERRAGLEDLLWGLLNAKEFLLRR